MNLTLTSKLHEQVTPEYLAALDAAIATIEHASEFAISLTNLERIRMRGFGPSNESFVPDVIAATTLHADLVPARCGAPEIAARRDATVALLARVLRLEEIRQRLSDTARVTGDACVSLSLDAYQFLKRMAEAEGIEATVDRLARRFAANVLAARQQAAAHRAAAQAPAPGSAAPAPGGTAAPAPSGGSATSAATPPAAAAPNLVALPAAAAPLAQAA